MFDLAFDPDTRLIRASKWRLLLSLTCDEGVNELGVPSPDASLVMAGPIVAPNIDTHMHLIDPTGDLKRCFLLQ